MVTPSYHCQIQGVLIIQEFATALRMKALASAAEMGFSQCGEMQGLDVVLVDATNWVRSHSNVIKITANVIADLDTMELTAINALRAFGELQWTAR